MSRSQTVVGVWVIALALGLPYAASARADDQDDQEPQNASAAGWLENTRARAELGLSGRSDRRSSLGVFSPIVGLDYRFSHGFGLGLDWAFVIASEVPERQSALWFAGPGAPMFKVWYEHASGADELWQLYAGLNVPAAWLPRDVVHRALARNSYALAAATRGLWDAWLWVPEQMALAVGGSYRHQWLHHLRLRVEAAVAGSVSLSWLTSDVGALYGQLAPAVEYVLGSAYVGVRAQAVVLAPQSDPLQLSAGAYVGFAQSHWTLEARGLCNIDQPLGFVGSGLSVCGAWLYAWVSP
jgi:hypothetical protein